MLPCALFAGRDDHLFTGTATGFRRRPCVARGALRARRGPDAREPASFREPDLDHHHVRAECSVEIGAPAGGAGHVPWECRCYGPRPWPGRGCPRSGCACHIYRIAGRRLSTSGWWPVFIHSRPLRLNRYESSIMGENCALDP